MISGGQAVYLAGPTASGKSELAWRLAERLNGEIISVDSMQVYRGLDIGTAKPSLAERGRVPHHLVDVVNLKESFSAAQFVTLAGAASSDIEQRGKVAIFCGGTGLYFKAYLEGLGEAAPPDAQLRSALESTPTATLLKELAGCDPVLYATIDKKNRRRLVRAIEVFRATGRPLSEQREAWRKFGSAPQDDGPASRPFFIGLERSSEDLHERINQRVERMFQRGLVEETRRLLALGLAENPTALQAIGYRQVVEYLRGERSLDETVEGVKIRTRQFAKRQKTWFRHQAQLNWINLAPGQPAETVADHLAKRFFNGFS
jgi:tRNA dimethylallyltransferase